MKKIISIIGLIVAQSISSQTLNYNQLFEKGSLRIDFLISGTSHTQNISIHHIKKEPFYGANSSKQLIYPDYGNYKIVIRDRENHIIFSKGFSPIFSEWQKTDEAKNKFKSFEHFMQIPFPKNEISFEIEKRNNNGVFERIFSEKIDPQNYQIINEKVASYPVQLIQTKYPSDKAVDIAIVAEGYTKEEMPEFIKDVHHLVDYMFSVAPFKQYKNHFNIYAIESPSEESGTDIPGKNIYKNTILDSKFYTFNTPRYLTTFSMFQLGNIVASVPYDQIVVVVNTKRYGGGGFYNFMNLLSAQNQLSKQVFVHEFGHGFVGLADEYYDNTITDDSLYNLKIEPWEPNITTLVNFDNKWKKMMNPSTPIPTPRTEPYKNTIGVFEGGGYLEKRIYSPAEDCRMKTNHPENFCPVCLKAIEETILFHIH